VPWSDCPNKNVFSDRLNREYYKSAFRKSDGKLFQSLVAAAQRSCPRNSWMFGGQSAYKLLSLYKSLSLSCIIKTVILIQGHEPLAGAVATKSACHIKWAPNRCWDFDPITCPTAFF